MTNADVAIGLVGSLVVLARLNATTPDVLTTTPTAASIRAAPTRKTNGNSSGATSDDASHMQSAKNSATRGGGILSSSELMTACVGHSAPLIFPWLVMQGRRTARRLAPAPAWGCHAGCGTRRRK